MAAQPGLFSKTGPPGYFAADTDSILTSPSSAKLMADIEKTRTLERTLKAVSTSKPEGSVRGSAYGGSVQGGSVHGSREQVDGPPRSASRTSSLVASETAPVVRQNVSRRGMVEANRETLYTTLPLGQTLTIETDVEGSQKSGVGREVVSHSPAHREGSQLGSHRLYSAGSERRRSASHRDASMNISMEKKTALSGGFSSSDLLRRSTEDRMHRKWQREGVFWSKRQYCCNGHNSERRNWEWHSDFTWASLVLAIGATNAWRFPSVLYNNGGAAFFVPYLVIFFLVGCPLMLLEVAVGQYSGQGVITVWWLAPLFMGIGAGMVVAMFYLAAYFSTYISWALLYLVGSFGTSPPWATCNNSWNSPNCFLRVPDILCNLTDQVKASNGSCLNITVSGPVLSGVWNRSAADDFIRPLSAEEYFHSRILELGASPGIQSPGVIRWQLLVAFLAVWILVFLANCKAIKSYGKVAYMTGIVWLVLTISLLVRALTLDGYYTALHQFLKEDWAAIATVKAWAEAAIQVFFNLICGWGVSVYFGSNNKFHKKSFRDCFLVCLLIAGLHVVITVIAAVYIGVHAEFLQTTIATIMKRGDYLFAFILLPAAVSSVPLATLWSVIYFVVLILAGFDTVLLLVACISGSLADVAPRQLYFRRTRLTLVVVLLIMLLGLATCTHGGVYTVQLLHTHVIGWPILVLALCQTIVICWIFGLRNLSHCFEEMFGYPTSLLWLLWFAVLPLFILTLLVLVILNLVWTYQPLGYLGYVFPIWAQTLGWLVSISIVILVLLVALGQLCRGKGSLRSRLSRMLRPSHKWSPGADRHREYHALDGLISNMQDVTVKKEGLYTITGALAGRGAYPPTDPGDREEYEIQQVQLHMTNDGIVDNVQYTSRDDMDRLALDEVSLNERTGSYNVTTTTTHPEAHDNTSIRLYRALEDVTDFRQPQPLAVTTLPRSVGANVHSQQGMDGTHMVDGAMIARSSSFSGRTAGLSLPPSSSQSHVDHYSTTRSTGDLSNIYGHTPSRTQGYSETRSYAAQTDVHGYTLRSDPGGYSSGSQTYLLASPHSSVVNRTIVEEPSYTIRPSTGYVNPGYSDYHTGSARVVYPNTVQTLHVDSQPEYMGTMYITKKTAF